MNVKMMKRLSFLLFAILCSMTNVIAGNYEKLYEGLPFDMPILKKPQFPDYQVSIESFGAVADGITLNTNAINNTIAHVSAKGGGTVLVPSGVWFTGPIVMQSNINLHLERGALILFSSDSDLYPLVHTVFEGLDTRRCQSSISGVNLENVAITGEGAINGSGDAWRPLKKMKVTDNHWRKVTQSGGALKDPQYWVPSEDALLGEQLMSERRELTADEWEKIKVYLRPVMVSFIECKNLLLEGVLFENSPGWNIHPLMCENVIIDGIEFRNPSYAQNGDGLDLESCKNSIIVNSSFDVGYVAICIKSVKDADGRRRGPSTENVMLNNRRVL